MKSKGDGIKSVISNISEQNGEIKITLKDGIVDVKKIIFRSEELTPYQRYVCFNGCFTADTLVVTENGYKEISSIVDGELVLARDEMTEDIGYKKAKLIQKLAEELVLIKVANENIQATKDHLFMSDKGWIRAGELKEGDKLLTREEIYRTIENVEKTGYNKGKVYNLEVEDYHTFYISKLGILVHNDYSIKELKDIYKKFNSSIKDVGLKAEFKTMLDKLESLQDGKIKDNLIKDFHGKFEGLTDADDAGIRKIIGDVNENITERVSEADFTGKLRGENITLKDVKTKEISYVKRDTAELNKLRNYFNTTGRKNFLEDLSKNVEYLKESGFTEKDILKMQNGRVPDGWQVHNKLPLDDSGTNSFDNLVSIKNEPYHKAITNYQNSFAKQLTVGEIKSVNWPIPEVNIYPKKN
ncbi:polymorphic toxin-type HINT domain-containing protein [Clostridium paraputrificum]|uniref:Hint domain-containing protein n=1 Tax=Clostridium paraputrificum TaxID=29363 RepID=UPI003D340C0A